MGLRVYLKVERLVLASLSFAQARQRYFILVSFREGLMPEIVT